MGKPDLLDKEKGDYLEQSHRESTRQVPSSAAAIPTTGSSAKHFPSRQTQRGGQASH